MPQPIVDSVAPDGAVFVCEPVPPGPQSITITADLCGYDAGVVMLVLEQYQNNVLIQSTPHDIDMSGQTMVPVNIVEAKANNDIDAYHLVYKNNQGGAELRWLKYSF